ncbi:thioredoxin family protein [Paraflavitalea sp. CAU 1676]|uniref:thioredoxin family protein n=1 Tax=Paraflavitalea sp. CAU 1676 TaxID=3032598 RepID=UPI0023DB4036|nr:thioredoxin family protein [Paraflavitalea sp. CAU 1676]MDF2192782.1 thioredoxin family protein [Paraflavitalea sp. CAU 1676]
MKWMLLLLLAFQGSSTPGWEPDYETAVQQARAKDRLILLSFSGSDWCGPCIQLRKEVFESEAFLAMADSSLILYNADFPRNRKNQLPKARQQQNEELAGQYNPQGKFPFTVLLSADGKVIKSWDGYPQYNSTLFLEQLRTLVHGHRP